MQRRTKREKEKREMYSKYICREMILCFAYDAVQDAYDCCYSQLCYIGFVFTINIVSGSVLCDFDVLALATSLKCEQTLWFLFPFRIWVCVLLSKCIHNLTTNTTNQNVYTKCFQLACKVAFIYLFFFLFHFLVPCVKCMCINCRNG